MGAVVVVVVGGGGGGGGGGDGGGVSFVLKEGENKNRKENLETKVYYCRPKKWNYAW